MTDTGPPAAHRSITRATIAALIADQHPDLADLPLGERFDGWDMAMFRLGSDLAVRLPRVEAAVRSLRSEQRWLPLLGPAWSFPYPHLARAGEPGHGFPFPWAIVTWVPGTTADARALDASAGTAVGRAIAEIHAPAHPDAPYNPEQSLTLSERQADLDYAMAIVRDRVGPDGQRLDATAVMRNWELALDAAGPRERRWAHADLHGSNLLARDGDFAGIIDWGKMAACDPAVDLAFLYSALPAAGVRDAIGAYREATGIVDAGLEQRIAGVAVSKCLLWATLDRPLNVTMAWRGLEALGVTVRSPVVSR